MRADPRRPPRHGSSPTRPPSSPAGSTRRSGPSTRSAARRGSSPRPTGYWLTDADDNRYVDLVCSWGPMILGHAHPAVVEAVQRAAADGLTLRRADARRRASWPREIIGRVGAGRADPAGQLRHRGHHERDPAGPRLHRPRQDRQVLRLLPRPQRRAARRRRLGRRDARPAVLARCHRRRRRRHDRVALQRHRRGRGGVRRVRRRDRLRHHRGRRGQHGHRRRRCPATTPRCAASPPSTARC